MPFGPKCFEAQTNKTLLFIAKHRNLILIQQTIQRIYVAAIKLIWSWGLLERIRMWLPSKVTTQTQTQTLHYNTKHLSPCVSLVLKLMIHHHHIHLRPLSIGVSHSYDTSIDIGLMVMWAYRYSKRFHIFLVSFFVSNVLMNAIDLLTPMFNLAKTIFIGILAIILFRKKNSNKRGVHESFLGPT